MATRSEPAHITLLATLDGPIFGPLTNVPTIPSEKALLLGSGADRERIERIERIGVRFHLIVCQYAEHQGRTNSNGKVSKHKRNKLLS